MSSVLWVVIGRLTTDNGGCEAAWNNRTGSHPPRKGNRRTPNEHRRAVDVVCRLVEGLVALEPTLKWR